MNRARRLGTDFEVAVRDYFRDHGWPGCERPALEGALDRGDLVGLPATVQCKNLKCINLAGTLAAARKQAQTAGQRHYVAVHKRRMHPTAEAYVTMPLWAYVELLAEAQQ